MKCEKAMGLISEYIDGNLDHRQVDSLKQHLDSCAECRSLQTDFQKIVEETQDLETLEPPESGWAEIRKELEINRQKVWEKSVRKSRHVLPVFKPAWTLGAALLLVVLIGTLTFGPAILRKAPSLEVDGHEVAFAKLVEAENHYQLAIKAMGEALAASQRNMAPETAKVFQDNLELINVSLSACKQAILKDPENIDSRRYLLTMYKQKADLLSQMVSLDTDVFSPTEKKTKT
ncbi:zf-HC2 domain-containing protein [Acidobacteriota bacterium]